NIDSEGLRQSYVDEGLRNIAPVWEREFKAFNQDMANRGIPINSEIYNDKTKEMQQSHSDYLTGLTNQAHQAAAADESRQFQQEIAKHQLPWQDYAQASQNEDMQLAQAMAQHALPYTDFQNLSGEQSRLMQLALAENSQQFNNFANFYNAVQGM